MRLVALGLSQDAVDTIEDALNAWTERAQKRGFRRPEWDLQALRGLPDALPVQALTWSVLRQWLDGLSDLSPATQRSYWKSCRRFCRWMVARGILIADPTVALLERMDARDEVFPWTGGVPAGKAQLTEGEAKRYLDTALAHEKRDWRIGAAMPLLTGICSGELRALQVGDVDPVANAIWIRRGTKNASRLRSVPLPSSLRHDLICTSDLPSERTRTVLTSSRAQPYGRRWLLDVVTTTCRLSCVPRVTPHGLRGTYASLLRERMRRSMADVASALGHGDTGSTAERHYVSTTPELDLG